MEHSHSMSSQIQPAALHRPAANWVSYALAIGLIAVALAPFVLTLGYFIPAGLVGLFSSSSQTIAAEDRKQDRASGSSLDWLDKGPIGSLAKTPGIRASDRALVFKLMPLTV